MALRRSLSNGINDIHRGRIADLEGSAITFLSKMVPKDLDDQKWLDSRKRWAEHG